MPLRKVGIAQPHFDIVLKPPPAALAGRFRIMRRAHSKCSFFETEVVHDGLGLLDFYDHLAPSEHLSSRVNNRRPSLQDFSSVATTTPAPTSGQCMQKFGEFGARRARFGASMCSPSMPELPPAICASVLFVANADDRYPCSPRFRCAVDSRLAESLVDAEQAPGA